MKTKNLLTPLSVLFIFVIFSYNVNAQSPNPGDLIWYTFQGGLKAEEIYAIDRDSNGNLYVVGKGETNWDMTGQTPVSPVNPHNPPNQSGNREFDVFTAKFSSDGVLVWYTFMGNGYSNDDGWDIAVDSNGNVFIVGTTRNWYQWGGNSIEETRAFLAKLDNSGTFQWMKVLGQRNSNDEAKGVALDASGNVYVLGNSTNNWTYNDGSIDHSALNPYATANVNNIFLTKFSNTGNYDWHTFIGPGVATGEDLVLKGANIYIAGYASLRLTIPGLSPAIDHAAGVDDFPYADGLVLKLNTDGNILWYTFLGFNYAEAWIPSGVGAWANAIDADDAGRLYVTGGSWRDFNNSIPILPRYSSNGIDYNGGNDCFAVKINSNDNTPSCIEWSTFMGYDKDDRGEDIKLDKLGNVFVGGNGLTPTNVLTMMNNNGVEQWRRELSNYPGTGNLKGIVPDESGNLFFAGYSGVPWAESLGGNIIHEHQSEWYNDAFVAKIYTGVIFNNPPVFTVDQNPVYVQLGNQAVNTGIIYDADGDDIWMNSDPGGHDAIVNNGDGTWTWTVSSESLGIGYHWITLWADDGNNPAVYRFFNLYITTNENLPPVLTCPPDITMGTTNGCKSDEDIGMVMVNDDNDPNPEISNDAPELFSLGETTVTWTATDNEGESSTCTQVVTVIDDDPPVITCPGDFEVGTNSECTFIGEIGEATAIDNCDVDIEITNDAPSVFPLGETTVTWTAEDAAGNTAICEQFINVINTVPVIALISASVIDPIPVNTEILLNVEFTDNENNVLLAEVEWGDGIVEIIENPSSGFALSHSYEFAGVYSVLVKLNDGCETTSDKYNYIVVYDSTEGFVTGGGWIYSPHGAYIPDESIVGKANFGFVSKYKKGKSVPEGNTEFKFKAAELNFHSKSYEWLVIAGAKAMFKGEGTINNEGRYGFQLSAIDAELTPSSELDKFRIRIWDKNNNDELVYDNKIDDLDPNSEPDTEISGGSIKIHKNKLKSSFINESIIIANNLSGIKTKIYPNPTNGKVILEIENYKSSSAKVKVINILGQTILEHNYTLPGPIELNLSGHVSGLYFIEVNVDDLPVIHKINLINN